MSTLQHGVEFRNMFNLASFLQYQLNFPKVNSKFLHKHFSNFTALHIFIMTASK